MSILEQIRSYKLADVAARKAARPLADIEAAAREAGPVRGFRGR
jgi:indole-3-glycerol phosphate synthase